MSLQGTPVPVIQPPTGVVCNDQNYIEPKQTIIEGCPVLPKLQCHEVQMGQDARLIWNFKDSTGENIDLTNCYDATCISASSQPAGDFDAIGTPTCGATLRIRELSGYDPVNDLVYSVDVDVLESRTGLVRARSLPDAITRSPGIYVEEWAFFSTDGRMLFSNQCCTFVRRGLFGLSTDLTQRNYGPPTIEEIRLSLRDNAPADNLLLDALEFDAAEISQAVLRPIQMWNETPPPINPLMTTKTFPFREMWLLGIQGYLMDIAANNYSRNHLAYNAGGMSVDDKNKFQQYQQKSMALLQQFQNMLRAKKIEINISLFGGTLHSPYGGLFYP